MLPAGLISLAATRTACSLSPALQGGWYVPRSRRSPSMNVGGARVPSRLRGRWYTTSCAKPGSIPQAHHPVRTPRQAISRDRLDRRRANCWSGPLGCQARTGRRPFRRVHPGRAGRSVNGHRPATHAVQSVPSEQTRAPFQFATEGERTPWMASSGARIDPPRHPRWRAPGG